MLTLSSLPALEKTPFCSRRGSRNCSTRLSLVPSLDEVWMEATMTIDINIFTEYILLMYYDVMYSLALMTSLAVVNSCPFPSHNSNPCRDFGRRASALSRRPNMHPVHCSCLVVVSAPDLERGCGACRPYSICCDSDMVEAAASSP